LHHTKISDSAIEEISQESNIAILVLDGTAATDQGLERLKRAETLKAVSVAGASVTKDGVAALRSSLPHALVKH
jgi:hypothetical protein